MAGYTKETRSLTFIDNGSGIPKRTYFTVRQPGCVPIVKTPPDPSFEGVESFARELVEAYPEADIQILELIWTGELWADSVASWLAPKQKRRRKKKAA